MILYQLFCIQGLARGTSQTPERLSWWRSPSGCCRPPRPRCTCNSGKGCSRSTTWDAPRTCWTCRLARLLVVGLWHTVARPKKKWFAGWEIGSPIVHYHGLSCYHDHLPSAEVVSELMLLVFPNPIQVFRGKSDLEDYILGSLGISHRQLDKLLWKYQTGQVRVKDGLTSCLSDDLDCKHRCLCDLYSVQRITVAIWQKCYILALILDYLLVGKSQSELQISLHLQVQDAP